MNVFLDIDYVFMNKYCSINKIVCQFLSFNGTIAPDAGCFDGTTRGTKDTLNTWLDSNPCEIFNPAIPTKITVFS